MLVCVRLRVARWLRGVFSSVTERCETQFSSFCIIEMLPWSENEVVTVQWGGVWWWRSEEAESEEGDEHVAWVRKRWGCKLSADPSPFHFSATICSVWCVCGRGNFMHECKYLHVELSLNDCWQEITMGWTLYSTLSVQAHILVAMCFLCVRERDWIRRRQEARRWNRLQNFCTN